MKFALVAAILATLTCQAQAQSSWGDAADERVVLMRAGAAFAGSSCKGIGLLIENLDTATASQNVTQTEVRQGGRLYWPTVKMVDYLLKRPDRAELCLQLYQWFGENGSRVRGILYLKGN